MDEFINWSKFSDEPSTATDKNEMENDNYESDNTSGSVILVWIHTSNSDVNNEFGSLSFEHWKNASTMPFVAQGRPLTAMSTGKCFPKNIAQLEG